MNLIIEGTDAQGKGTQIQLAKNYLEKNGYAVHVIHYSNLRFSDDNEEIKKASQLLYKDMFDLMAIDDFNTKSGDVGKKRAFIFDRAHLGEVVYSPIYRGYEGDYVYGYEDEYLMRRHPRTKMILFSDTVENVIARDKARGDGLSFSLDPEKKKEELEAFEKAARKSHLDTKIIFLKGRTPDEIFTQDVLPFMMEPERK